MGDETRSPCGACNGRGVVLLIGGSGFGGGACPMGCTPPASYTCPFPGCGAVNDHPLAPEFCSTCNRSARALLGLLCPGCLKPAAFRIVGQQAFCGNDDCKVLAWEPDMDASQFANSITVDLVDRSEKSSG